MISLLSVCSVLSLWLCRSSKTHHSKGPVTHLRAEISCCGVNTPRQPISAHRCVTGPRQNRQWEHSLRVRDEGIPSCYKGVLLLAVLSRSSHAPASADWLSWCVYTTTTNQRSQMRDKTETKPPVGALPKSSEDWQYILPF